METYFPKLNLPFYEFHYKETEKGVTIFDRVRKKYVKLTPEEWVRQNVVEYLVCEKGFPRGLLALEMQLKVQQRLTRRCDIVAYSREAKPLLIVECKAPEVKITQKAFDQAAQYNMELKVDHLLVTNGNEHFCCRVDYYGVSYDFLREVPKYDDL